MARPPCAFSDILFPCDECNRHFRSRTIFANHKQSSAKRKSVCERKRCCASCGLLAMGDVHEFNKRYGANCKQNRDVGHLCNMRPLKDVLSDACDKVLYVFYDFQTTQIRSTLTRPQHTYLIWSGNNSSVRSAKVRKTVVTMCDTLS